MNKIGNKINDARKRKGLTQEELAEASKVNLRTIQRIENNENEPRGKTLLLICNALNINIENLLDSKKENNTNYSIGLHLSVLSMFIIPLGNILIPLIIWVTQKDKINHLKPIGANLLNFQVLWSAVTYLSLILFIVAHIFHITNSFLNFKFLIFFWLISNLINIILPILFAIKTSQGKTHGLYPNILKLIK
ncbi:hypothetical protein GCM10022291_25720 [Postechiella marina]|uniref:HTH cro/C1-type domain-containing protein n=1 Tax=Postechiella marina TaxID=943941 RepID=A0ABP8CD30_9FLAO